MKALVTGSVGLVGRHMTKRLEDDGWNVSTWDIADGNDALTCFRMDENRYDLVVHAAYHVGGRAGIDGTNANFPRNVQLDGAMFDWAVRTKQRRVLYFSSSAAYPVHLQKDTYGVRPQIRLDEARQPEGGFNGLPDANYGWAKLTGERMAIDARKNGVGVTVVRPFSGYADDQSLDYPFPAIVNRAIHGEHSVWGPIGQARDWIHMDDVVSACMELAINDVQGPVNLCTGRAVTMADLLRKIVGQLHLAMPHEYPHGDEISVQHLTDRPTGVFYRVGNPDLLHEYYTPKVSLEDGIHRAIVAGLERLGKS